MPRWAADGVREGMNSLTAALDSLVRCSESGIPRRAVLHSFSKEPSASLPLRWPRSRRASGTARRHFLGRIASRALCLSTGYAPFPGYEGCPPTALRSSASASFSGPAAHLLQLLGQLTLRDLSRLPGSAPSSGIAAHPLFVRELLLETLPASAPSSHRTAGTAAGRQLDRRNPLCRHRRGALYRGGERSQTLLPDMIRFEDHLPRAASIAELDGLIAEFHKLERGCSGTVRLYGAPKTARTAPCRSANASPHPCRNPVIPTAGSTI